MQTISRIAVLAALATAVTVPLGGVASAETYAERTDPNYDGGTITLEYDASQHAAVANGDGGAPYLQYKADFPLPFGTGVDLLTLELYDEAGERSIARNDHVDDGPVRACMDYGLNFGDGLKTLCTPWLNGQ